MKATIIRHSRTVYRVAVYWLNEGSYGGSDDYTTLNAAMERGERLEKLGYDKPGKCEIHIQKITNQLMRMEQSDGTGADTTVL